MWGAFFPFLGPAEERMNGVFFLEDLKKTISLDDLKQVMLRLEPNEYFICDCVAPFFHGIFPGSTASETRS